MDRLQSIINVDLNVITENIIPDTPTWLISRPVVDFSLHTTKKDNQTPELHKILHHLYIENKPDFKYIYTDGSKDCSGTSAAAITDNYTAECKICSDASIFTAEAHAIVLALRFIESSTDNRFIIFSDSIFCLQATANMKFEHPSILAIIQLHRRIVQSGNKEIILCWIPSHVGIKGNESADAAAKRALLNALDSTVKIPYTDLKAKTTAYFKLLFQNRWNNVSFDKLRSIKEEIGKTVFANISARRDEIVLHRARIGHTHLTHAYLLRGEDAPECVNCQCLLTVEHLLLRCPVLDNIRLKYFSSINTLQQLFKDITPTLILNYLKEINYCEKF